MLIPEVWSGIKNVEIFLSWILKQVVGHCYIKWKTFANLWKHIKSELGLEKKFPPTVVETLTPFLSDQRKPTLINLIGKLLCFYNISVYLVVKKTWWILDPLSFF